MNLIDAHCHLNTRSKAKMKLALERGASFLSINTDIPFFDPIGEQEAVVLDLKRDFPEQVRYMGTFSSAGFGNNSWLANTIDQIKKTVDNGATGIKIWKNFGMELRDKSGQFVMVSDERLDPVFDFLSMNKIPLIAHIGEPRNCWLPLEQMTVDSDRNYFTKHPEYHMYLHKEFPDYLAQIGARDQVLEKHPDLVFIGAHFGSMEWDLTEVGKRLELYPNFYVDMAERICHVQLQGMKYREMVRDFFIRYQDRIIYGSDVIDSFFDHEDQAAARFDALWSYHWQYFSSEDIMEAEEFEGEFQGLGLPTEVLEKLFVINAAKIYGFKN